MRWIIGFLFGILLTVVSCPAAEESPPREATAAVVNPAVRSSLRERISLDGVWEFATDPENAGRQQQWHQPGIALPDAISLQVPGCWEAQGVGGPGDSVSVAPERSIRPLIGSYVGPAWYKKTVSIPAHWQRKQIWIQAGGIHAQGWLWVNGTYIGHIENYCGTYKYNITDLVRAGESVTVAVLVRNDVPSGKGLKAWIHRFGGIYRSVELEATGDVFVDYAYVEGDLDAKTAKVHVAVRSMQDAAVSGIVEASEELAKNSTKAGSASQSFTLNPGETRETVLTIPLNPFLAWSPESPNLYVAEILLKVDEKTVDGWTERFGVKKWEVRGEQFYLNNQPYFVRGYGDDFIYPLTLCSPASLAEHKKHLLLAKSYGFNYVRHHTHCEVPEFYEACDEVGIMVQPELPYYGMRTSANAEGFFRPREDLRELIDHYRRYVSLSTYCTGNEGHIDSPLDEELYRLGKELDPSRLFLHQDGGKNTPENSDFCTGPFKPWKAEETDYGRPFFAHEYLNLSMDEDPRLESLYTGAVRAPVREEAFRRDLQEYGLSREWGTAVLNAGRQLQRIYQKLGLEQARRDPKCDGYIFWTIVDVGSPSAQGLFDPFWRSKAATAEYFYPFNGADALLADIEPSSSILCEGDTLSIEWLISAFSGILLKNPILRWKLIHGTDILAEGRLDSISIECGCVQSLGRSTCRIPAVSRAFKAQLIGELEDTGIENRWNLWLFPKGSPDRISLKAVRAGRTVYGRLKAKYPEIHFTEAGNAEDVEILITDTLDEGARRALELGKKVLWVGLPGPKPGAELGWWKKSGQTGTAIARHPAFGDFPHEGYLDRQFFRLVDSTVSRKEAAYRDAEPLMVGGGKHGYLLYAFQAKAGTGKLLATGLKALDDLPEAEYLLEQFLRYMHSDSFEPAGEIDLTAFPSAWGAMDAQGRPLIVKRGTVDRHLAETTPVVFGGTLYRFEYVHKEYWGNTTEDTYFRFVDPESGRVVSTLAAGYHTGCAFAEGDTMVVLGTNRWGGDRVDLFYSTDLKTWQSRNALNLPKYKIYNTSLCRAGNRYVMMFEIGEPRELAGDPFTAMFAESRDLKEWKVLPPECNYAKDRYTAPHCLRYWDGYFYNFYLESLENPQRYQTYVVRSRDLIHWQSSPLNPVLASSEEDRRILNPALPEDQRAPVKQVSNINNSDIDFCEVEGRVVIYYAWGNQNGEEYLAEAYYNGTAEQFLAAWFPE